MTRAKVEMDELGNYAIPPEHEDVMKFLKLPYSKKSAIPHPHPIHAALRYWLLTKEIPKYCDTDVALVSFSEGNVKKIVPHLKHNHRVINPIADIKDLGRTFTPDSIPATVCTLPRFSESTCVSLGNGHFYTPGNILALFEQNPTLRILVLNHEYPMSVTQSFRSPRPTLYSMTKVSDTMMSYCPEEDVGGTYYQPIKNEVLFSHRIDGTIQKDGSIVTVYGALVASKLNTHLQVWTRYSVSVPPAIAIMIPGMMKMPAAFRGMKCESWIPVEYYRKSYEYAMVVAATNKDIAAKIRQQIDADKYQLPISDKIILIRVVQEVVRKAKYPNLQSKHYDTLMGEIYYRTLGHLVRFKHQRFETKYFKRYAAIIDEPEGHFTVPTIAIKCSSSESNYQTLDWKVEGVFSTTMLDRLKTIILSWYHGEGVRDKTKLRAVTVEPDGTILVEGRIVFPSLSRPNGLTPREVLTAQFQDYKNLILDHNPLPVTTRKVPAYVSPPPPVPPKPPGYKKANAAGRPLPRPPSTKDPYTWVPMPAISSDRCALRQLCVWAGTSADIDGFSNERVKQGMPPLPLLDLTLTNMDDILTARKVIVNWWQNTLASTMSSHKDGVDLAIKFTVEPDGRLQWTPGFKSARPPLPRMVKLTTIPEETEADRAISKAVDDIISIHSIHTVAEAEVIVEKIVESKAPTMTRIPHPTIHPSLPAVNPRPTPVITPIAPIPVPNGYPNQDLYELSVKVDKILNSPACTREIIPSHLTLKRKWDLIWPKSQVGRFPQDFQFEHFPKNQKYPVNDCLLEAISKPLGLDKANLFAMCLKTWPARQKSDNPDGLDAKNLHSIGCSLRMMITLQTKTGLINYGVNSTSAVRINFQNGHFDAVAEVKGMLVRPVELLNSTPQQAKLINELSNLPTIIWQKIRFEASRGVIPVRDWRDGVIGTMGSLSLNQEYFRAIEDEIEQNEKLQSERMIAVVEGDPGCRKSSPVQQVLRKLHYHKGNAFKVVLPTNALANDWKNKCDATTKLKETGKGLPSTYIQTFERAFADGHPSTIMIFDEDKFCTGYIAAMALHYPMVTHVIFMCDRYQTRYHETSPNATIHSLPHIKGEGEHYSAYTKQYLTGTWRFGPGCANLWRMPTFNNSPFHLYILDSPLVNGAQLQQLKTFKSKSVEECNFLVEHALTCYPADADVRAADMSNEAQNMTMNSTQGKGEDIVIVMITQTALNVCDYRTLYTAMTRAKKTMIICMCFIPNGPNLGRVVAHPIISVLARLQGQTARGEPVHIGKGDFIDIKEVLGELPDHVSQVYAGPPSKLANGKFLFDNGFKFDKIKGYIDPDAPPGVITGGFHGQLSRDDPAFKDNPQFLTHVIPMPRVILPEPTLPFHVPLDYKLTTHLPVESRSSWLESQHSQIKDRSVRELTFGPLFSNQFPDEYLLRHDADFIMKKQWSKLEPNQRKQIGNLQDYRRKLEKKAPHTNPLRYNPILMNFGQLQASTDLPSVLAGIQQRIRFGTLEANKFAYENKTDVFGPALFEGFKKAFGLGLPVPFDTVHFEDCIIRFSQRRAERPAALKKAALPRSEPDFKNWLTTKSQWKQKDPHPPNAKPLQTILLHGDENLFMLGPVGIYVLDKIKELCPPHILLLAKTSFEELNNWCKTYVPYDPNENHFESDITGFDANCDHNTVKAFELFLRHLNIPEEYIHFFIDSKSSVMTQWGVHLFATFSGEIFTWLINTFKTISRRHTKSNVPWGLPQAYTGDDEWLSRTCPDRPQWSTLKQYDGSEEKVIERPIGSLASFYLTPDGAFKDPEILLRRYIVGIQRGKLADIHAGYYLEFQTIFNKGDLLYRYLTEEQMTCQQLLASEIFNASRRYKVPLHIPMLDKVKAEFLTTRLNPEALQAVASVMSNDGAPYTGAVSNTTPTTSFFTDYASLFDNASW
jgi:hypothetical protein